MKKNKGITLVALIITIIVMLILVAVSVRIAIQSGLLDAAGKSTQTWTKEAEAEGNLSGIKIGDKDLNDYMSEFYEEEVQIPWRYETISDGTIKIKDFDYTKITEIKSEGYDVYKRGKYLLNTKTMRIPSKVDDKDVSEVALDYYRYGNITIDDVKTIIISEGVKKFYCNYTFPELESITIPASLTEITSAMAFPRCQHLKNIIVDKNNKEFDGRDNCNALIRTSTNELVKGTSTTVIPESVTSIGQDAFYGCSELQTITIPKAVTKIGSYAFYGLENLQSIVISKNVTLIEQYAFSRCNALTTVYYEGSAEEWKKIWIMGGNDFLQNANIIYNYVQE